jgi:DNA-binding MarR family transcriptional regulator
VKTAPEAIRKMFEEVSLGAPENAVGFVLWRIVARYQREVDRALVPEDLTHLQFITLALIAWFAREKRSVTQVELARSAGIHPMQISQTLKALETKKMVSRKRSKSDTRAKRVEVTAAGLDALRKALPKVVALQIRLFGEAGRPGGSLLEQLICLDKDLLDPAHQAEI